MKKDIPIQVRLTEDDLAKLEQIAKETVRTKSDMVRFLISTEYERRLAIKKNIPPLPEPNTPGTI